MTIESATAYIGVGSNMGNKVSNCGHSLERIDRLPGCQITARSDMFKTEPEGLVAQDWFANCVAEVKTHNTPQQLLDCLLAIESAMGRIRAQRWGPRIIDLDILLYGPLIMESENLTVPHPLLHKRRFVLEPLLQLAPDLIHPVLKLTIRQLFAALPKGSSAQLLKEGP